jgi:hypothetical protein
VVEELLVVVDCRRYRRKVDVKAVEAFHGMLETDALALAGARAFARASTVLQSGLVVVYAVVDDALSPDFPFGHSVDVFIRREDAERFVEEVRGDDPELASCLRIEERELGEGGLN